MPEGYCDRREAECREEEGEPELLGEGYLPVCHDGGLQREWKNGWNYPIGLRIAMTHLFFYFVHFQPPILGLKTRYVVLCAPYQSYMLDILRKPGL